MTDDDDFDSYVFSLSITTIVCYSDESKWILYTSATYHAVSKENDLLVLKN